MSSSLSLEQMYENIYRGMNKTNTELLEALNRCDPSWGNAALSSICAVGDTFERFNGLIVSGVTSLAFGVYSHLPAIKAFTTVTTLVKTSVPTVPALVGKFTFGFLGKGAAVTEVTKFIGWKSLISKLGVSTLKSVAFVPSAIGFGIAAAGGEGAIYFCDSFPDSLRVAKNWEETDKGKALQNVTYKKSLSGANYVPHMSYLRFHEIWSLAQLILLNTERIAACKGERIFEDKVKKIDEKIIQSLFGIKEHSVKWEEILSDQGVPTGGKVTIDVAGLHRNIQTIMDALDISDIPKTKETKRVLFSWLNETLKQVPDAKKVEFQIDSSTYEFTAY